MKRLICVTAMLSALGFAADKKTPTGKHPLAPVKRELLCAALSQTEFWGLVDTLAEDLSQTMPFDQAFDLAYTIIIQNPGMWDVCAAQ
jgi:hypothetical protein